MAYAEAEKAPSTRAAYAADWQAFAVWTLARGATPLPAPPAIVAAYLSHLANSGRKAAGIGRTAAAISDRHKQAGIDPSPTAHAGLKAVMKGIRRTLGRPIATTRLTARAAHQGQHAARQQNGHAEHRCRWHPAKATPDRGQPVGTGPRGGVDMDRPQPRRAAGPLAGRHRRRRDDGADEETAMSLHDLYGILWIVFVGVAAIGTAKFGFREPKRRHPPNDQ